MLSLSAFLFKPDLGIFGFQMFGGAADPTCPMYHVDLKSRLIQFLPREENTLCC